MKPSPLILAMVFLAMTIYATPLIAQNFTWMQTSAPNQDWESVASSADGTKLAAVVYNFGGIYTSTNSGITWVQTSAPNLMWLSIASSSDGTKLVAAAFEGGIYTSFDAGANWTKTSAQIINQSWRFITCSADGTKIFAGSESGIYTSTDSGTTWTQTSAPNAEWNSIACSSDGTKLAAVATPFDFEYANGIYTSTDSGTTWTQTSAPNQDWESVTSSSDGTKLAATYGGINAYGVFGGIYTSTDSGTTWTQTSAPNQDWESVTSSSDGTKLAAVCFANGIYTSTDSGTTWTQTSAPNAEWNSIACSSDGTELVTAAYAGGIFMGFIMPAINSQPLSQAVSVGSNANFFVTASGTSPLSYQWQLNGTNISNATNTIYSLTEVTTNSAGIYTVIVSNAGGSVTSSNAVFTVLSPHAGTGTAILTGSFVTGVSITDSGYGYTNTPLVRFIGGGGNGAGAFATVSNGVVISITVTNAGYGYTNAPLVVIDPPFIPIPVLGIAPMSFLSFSNLTVGGNYQLQQAAGWYWTNQPLSFTATNSLYTQMFSGVVANGEYRLALNPVPSQAFATPEVVNGFVVGATVTSGGSGYATRPAVAIVGRGGTNATAISQISGGVVTGISITDAGIGYTNATTVQIAPPPAAAIAPSVQPVMRLDSANLAPYDNYQIQFTPTISGTWGNWNGGLFTPTAMTNSQFLFITNGTGFFRLLYQF